jgi:hypothetical protein
MVVRRPLSSFTRKMRNLLRRAIRRFHSPNNDGTGVASWRTPAPIGRPLLLSSASQAFAWEISQDRRGRLRLLGFSRFAITLPVLLRHNSPHECCVWMRWRTPLRPISYSAERRAYIARGYTQTGALTQPDRIDLRASEESPPIRTTRRLVKQATSSPYVQANVQPTMKSGGEGEKQA